MGRAEDFTNLGESMLASFDDRVDFLGSLAINEKRRVAEAKKDTAERLKCERDRVAEAKKDARVRIDETREFLGECRRDNEKAHNAWQKVAKTMAARRRTFNNELKGTKQKAAHAR